jgi:hypothetical protein
MPALETFFHFHATNLLDRFSAPYLVPLHRFFREKSHYFAKKAIFIPNAEHRNSFPDIRSRIPYK